MRLTSLATLRKASPGSPTLRDLATKVGCSSNMLSMFERGESLLGKASMSRYAKAIGVTVEHVHQLFLTERHRFYVESAKQTLEELRALGKGRRVAKAS